MTRKKHKMLSLLLVLAMITAMLPLGTITASASAANWSSAADPSWYNSGETDFTIDSAEQLAGLASLVNAGTNFSGKTVTLGGDISLSDYDWTPIGCFSKDFNGIFNGAGYKINNLVIGSVNVKDNTLYYMGLFGSTGASAVIANVEVAADLYSGRNNTTYFGGLVGMNRGTITNSCATGTVSGDLGARAGGLVGENYGNIINCYARCPALSGGIYARVGGLVGENYGKIMNCYARCPVLSGGNYARVGGLVGDNGENGILNSYAVPGTVAVGSDAHAGGFVGLSYATIINCYWDIDAKEDDGTYEYSTGTAVGLSAVVMKGEAASIIYSEGTADTFLSALNGGTAALTELLPRGTNMGEWVADVDSSNGSYPELTCLAVPSVRVSPGSAIDSTKIVGTASSGNIFAIKTSSSIFEQPNAGDEITDAAQYTSGSDITGIDFTTNKYIALYELDSNNEVVKYMLITLVAEDVKALLGSGTEESPYLISSAGNLQYLAERVNSGTAYDGMFFSLTSDISLSGISSWTPIGSVSNSSNAFNGTFDGGGYEITGLTIGTESERNPTLTYLGLFGYAEEDAVIKNMSVDVSIYSSSTYSNVGGLVGYCGGTISNCSATGRVTGGDSSHVYVGGLAASCNIVTDCSSECSVTGGNYAYVGGLVGYCNEYVRDSSATGAVKGGDNSCVGGLIGSAYSEITGCHSEGIVTCGDATSNNCCYAGGLAGDAYGEIINSSATGNVECGNVTGASGYVYTGGLVGYLSGGGISACHADGNVSCGSLASTSGYLIVGGMIGATNCDTSNSHVITDCYATGDVTGGNEACAGGFVGWGSTNYNMRNCYATGAVECGNIVNFSACAGGFAGKSSDSTIVNCYSSGSVTGGNGFDTSCVMLGGFIGIMDNCYNSCVIENSYATGAVTGGNEVFAGGFVGNVSPVTSNPSFFICSAYNCYAAGAVTVGTDSMVGGLAGRLNTSYGSAKLINAYWNSDATTTQATMSVGSYVETKYIDESTGLTSAVLKGAAVTAGDIPYYTSYTDSDNYTVGTTVTLFATALNGGVSLLGSGTFLEWAAGSSGYPVFYVAVTGVGLNHSTMTLTAGGATGSLTPTVTPSNATNMNIIWSTDNSAVATVTNGVVTPVAAGTANITATTEDASKTASCTVTVNSAPAPSDDGSSSTPSGTTPANTTSTATAGGTTTATTTATATGGTGGMINASVTQKQISSAVTDAISAAKTQGTTPAIEIAVDADDNATGISATIPQSAFNTIADSAADALTITTPIGAVTFDRSALNAINGAASGDVTISVAKANTSTLSDEEKAAIGDRPVYDLTVSSGGTTISSFGGGMATVSIPYTPAKSEDANNIVIYYISDSGELVMMPNCIYDASTGKVTFTTIHFSTYAIGYNDMNFTDVSGWYEEYVNFLAARYIINGTGNGKFNPDAEITRAQFVTVLANLSGDDLSGYAGSTFSDVKSTDWYFAAVQWAYENGIANGSDGKFNPNATITKQDIAVMISRYAEKIADYDLPETNDALTFTDNAGIAAYAAGAVNAMQQAGIISGNPDGSFAPTGPATRAQTAKMIALLLQDMIVS